MVLDSISVLMVGQAPPNLSDAFCLFGRFSKISKWIWPSSVQLLSCLTLCHPMDCGTSGFPVHHQLPGLAQTHVHQVSDAIQPSPPLSSPSPPAFSLSRHQGLFKWVSTLHQVARVLEVQLQHQSFQWIFRTDFLNFRIWPRLLSHYASHLRPGMHEILFVPFKSRVVVPYSPLALFCNLHWPSKPDVLGACLPGGGPQASEHSLRLGPLSLGRTSAVFCNYSPICGSLTWGYGSWLYCISALLIHLIVGPSVV